jgi:hypothetical protein
MSTRLPINTQWQWQDETFGPIAIADRFPGLHDCGQVWPPHSPDINPCDFFLWSFMKDNLYARIPGSLMELRAMIIQLCRTTSEDLYRNVITNVRLSRRSNEAEWESQ